MRRRSLPTAPPTMAEQHGPEGRTRGAAAGAEECARAGQCCDLRVDSPVTGACKLGFSHHGTAMREAGFTPALGHSALTSPYDLAIRSLTREQRWRCALVDQIGPKNSETVLDVSCETGRVAIMLKRRAPGARVRGVDPDPAVLATAVEKARRAGVEIKWRLGFARDAANLGRFDQTVSALVFHQVPPHEKNAGLRAMLAALRPRGALHIADNCRQPDWLMCQLFRVIQAMDGRANTQANADGAVEKILTSLNGTRRGPRPSSARRPDRSASFAFATAVRNEIERACAFRPVRGSRHARRRPASQELGASVGRDARTSLGIFRAGHHRDEQHRHGVRHRPGRRSLGPLSGLRVPSPHGCSGGCFGRENQPMRSASDSPSVVRSATSSTGFALVRFATSSTCTGWTGAGRRSTSPMRPSSPDWR